MKVGQPTVGRPQPSSTSPSHSLSRASQTSMASGLTAAPVAALSSQSPSTVAVWVPPGAHRHCPLPVTPKVSPSTSVV
jgi:hypothetical protein